MSDTIHTSKAFDITYGMTQEEIIQQCLHVITYPNENINIKELQQMYYKINFERDGMGIIDMGDFRKDNTNNTWVRTQPIRDKLKELEFYL